MRALICGSRRWPKVGPVEVTIAGLRHFHPDLTIIHGAARGADIMADVSANALDVPVEVYPADWETWGRAAGPLRNMQMLERGRPDVVMAFTDEIDSSRGTLDMADRASEAGVPTYVMGRHGAGPAHAGRHAVALLCRLKAEGAVVDEGRLMLDGRPLCELTPQEASLWGSLAPEREDA